MLTLPGHDSPELLLKVLKADIVDIEHPGPECEARRSLGSVDSRVRAEVVVRGPSQGLQRPTVLAASPDPL